MHDIFQQVSREAELTSRKGNNIIAFTIVKNKLSHHTVEGILQVNKEEKRRALKRSAGIDHRFTNV